MLMITRRAGERVIIGGNIVVTLVEVSGQTARIGIEAPKSMPIFREEIWVEVMRENEAAARAASAKLPEIVAPLSAPAGKATPTTAGGGPPSAPSPASSPPPADAAASPAVASDGS